MIVKNSLITLALLATTTACGSDKKSYRHTHTNPDVVSPDKVVQILETTKEEAKPEVKVDEVKPETKTEVEASATPVPAVSTKEEPKPEEVKPEAKPESKAQGILGTWVGCKDSDDSSELVVQTFNDKGEYNYQHKMFKGQGCNVAYSVEEIETIRQERIEASKGKKGMADAEGVFRAELVAQTMKGFNDTYRYEVTSVDAQLIHITVFAAVKINLNYSIDGNKLTDAQPSADKSVFIRQ